jgi:hypothetical protein
VQLRQVALLASPSGLSSSDFVIRHRAGGLSNLHLMHRGFDALYFVLLFPYGDDGWRDHLHKSPIGTICTDATLATASNQSVRPQNRISARSYYAHRLCWRRGARYEGSRCVLMGGRLLQEYACTAYARVEMNNLRWHRFNQGRFRRERHSNLRAEVEQARAEQRDVQRCGQRVHLPSSFSGGPRDVRNAAYLTIPSSHMFW